MAKASYYPHPRWGITGIYVPEIRFSIDPPFGSDFFPGPQPLPPPDTKSGFTAAIPKGAAVTGTFEGWALPFHFARRL